MQPSPAPTGPTDSTAAPRGVMPKAKVPKARTAPGSRDPVQLPGTIEDQVARLADFVLKVWALAERYETAMARIAPSTQAFADQQARVEALHAAAQQGRSALVMLGR